MCNGEKVYPHGMKPYAIPIAYVRRSVATRNNPGDISREFQAQEVRRLAGDEAPRLVMVDRDWGKSAATDKTDNRLGFLDVLARVEAGEVSALYAYAADRLARSVEWSARLLNACRRAGVPIITGEGRFDPDNPLTDQLFYFQAMQNEASLRGMERKARSTTVRRRERGDKLGMAPYGKRLEKQPDGTVAELDNPAEPVQPIIDAFTEAGSAYGAARLLNARGIPARRGGDWTSKVVGDVLRRIGVIPARSGQRGQKVAGEWYFSQLLRCHCGHPMTGMDRRTPRYTCHRARHAAGHPLPFGIAERKLIAMMQAEAAHLSIPIDAIDVGTEGDTRRDELFAKRARVVDRYVDGMIDKADCDRRLNAIDDELDAIRSRQAIVELPQAVDWNAPPRTVNAVLRALWERVELGPDLMPVRFVWTVPQWRA